MKKLILVFLALFLLSSCTTHYIADNKPAIIKSKEFAASKEHKFFYELSTTWDNANFLPHDYYLFSNVSYEIGDTLYLIKARE